MGIVQRSEDLQLSYTMCHPPTITNIFSILKCYLCGFFGVFFCCCFGAFGLSFCFGFFFYSA